MARKSYKLESDLCADFLAGLPVGWTVYPEAHEYDIFLVRDDGLQIGLQAKLQFNVKVLDQALPARSTRLLPDYLGVLVPHKVLGKTVWQVAQSLCRKLSLALLTEGSADKLDAIGRVAGRWHSGDQRLPVPEFAANTAAGTPCPRTLSPWKIGAIKLGFIMLRDGKITAKQMKEHAQSPRIWLMKGWAFRSQRGVYVKGLKSPLKDYALEGKHLIESLFRDAA